MIRLNTNGFVDKEGNLKAFRQDKLKSFLDANKGKKVFVSFLCVEPNTVDDHVWYIIKKIVPEFIEGYRNAGAIISPEEALDLIIESNPLFIKHEKERYTLFDFEKYEPDTEMQAKDLEDAIASLHDYCQENFN